MIYLIKLWLPLLAWLGGIFFFSGLPYLNSGLDQDFLFRKAAHVSEYLILTLLFFRAFKGSFNKIKCSSLYLWSVTGAFLYAVSDEIHQSFVPGRQCAFEDVLIDSIGIGIAFLLIKFFLFKK